MLEERRVKWVEDYIVNPASVDGDESVDPLARPEEGKRDRSQPLPEGFILIYVRPCLAPRRARQHARSLRSTERGSSGRRAKRNDVDPGAGEGGGDEVPSWLIDKFALSCMAAEETVLRCAESESKEWSIRSSGDKALIDGKVGTSSSVRRIQVGLLKRLFPQLLRTLRRLSEKTHMHPPLRFKISDLISTIIHHPHLYSVFGSTSISDFKTFVRISRILFRPFAWRPDLLNLDIKGREYDQRKKLQEAMEREEWYAIEEDVRRLWRNLIRHRVELRPPRERILYTTVGSACTYRPEKNKLSYSSLVRHDERVDEILDDTLVVLG